MTSLDFKNALKNGNTVIRTFPCGESREMKIVRAGEKVVTLYDNIKSVKYQEFFNPYCDYDNKHGLNFKNEYKIK